MSSQGDSPTAPKYDQDFTDLMRHPRFRRWLWDLIERRCATFSDPFTLDARVTDRNLGMQTIGRGLLADVHRICPDLYVKALAEALSERETEQEQPDA